MLPPAAGSYWSDQQRNTAALMAVVKRLWRRMGNDFDGSWAAIADPMLLAVLQAQLNAADLAAEFVPAVLDELNVDAEQVADVAPRSVVGVTGAGYPVGSLLETAKVKAKIAVGEGATQGAALQSGMSFLDVAVRTLMSDTGRAVESASVAARRKVGFVRMLNPPSCSRCVVLAGRRFYRYNAGFKRHPGCDCRHIPSSESIADDLTVDPARYFHSLPKSEQDRVFTAAGAEAIRLGSDVGQVVNARSGMRAAQVFGKDILATDVGTTRRGVAYRAMSNAGYARRATDVRGNSKYFRARAPRLMPESILQIAEDRADAVRLLKLYGYAV